MPHDLHCVPRAAVRTLHWSLLAACVSLAGGCAQQPPKCSDASTLTVLRQLLAEDFGGKAKPSDLDLSRVLAIGFPRPTAFDEKIGKYSCEAQLTVAGYQTLVRYESQLDDQRQHLVWMEQLPIPQRMAFGKWFRDALDSSKTASSSEAHPAQAPSPPTAPPFSPTSILGTWKGPLEGDGIMQIAAVPGGYHVSLSVSTPTGCGGSISGKAVLEGATLKVAEPHDAGVCRVTINFTGPSAEVDENGCASAHGAACGFVGTLEKVSGR